MRVERDDYGDFNVRGACEDGEQGWDIRIWRKDTNPDGPEDFRYRVIEREFHQRARDQSLDGTIYAVDPSIKEAILALIDKWEERLPVMVASDISEKS